jgi:hypothetical protein
LTGERALPKHRKKIAVFNRDGDELFSASARELGNAAKDACPVRFKVHSVITNKDVGVFTKSDWIRGVPVKFSSSEPVEILEVIAANSGGSREARESKNAALASA